MIYVGFGWVSKYLAPSRGGMFGTQAPEDPGPTPPPHTRQGWKALHHKPLNCASMTDRRIRPVGPEVRVQFPLVCRRPPTQGRNTLFQLPATNLGIAAYQLAVTVLPKTDLACAQS